LGETIGWMQKKMRGRVKEPRHGRKERQGKIPLQPSPSKTGLVRSGAWGEKCQGKNPWSRKGLAKGEDSEKKGSLHKARPYRVKEDKSYKNRKKTRKSKRAEGSGGKKRGRG